MAAPPNTPTPAQVEATNQALSDLNFLQKGLLTNLLKQLPDVLDGDEMPERLLYGEYDDRNGLQVASGENHIGLLAATGRRLVFVSKLPIGRRKVYEFDYDDIEQTEWTKGLMIGALTVRANGRSEIFRAPNTEVEKFALYLEDRVD